jgi:hypothetical protein
MSMAHESTSAYSLTMPGVTIKVRSPRWLCLLRDDGEQTPTDRAARDTDIDWRALRSGLIKLNCEDRSAIAAWLRDAGYVPAEANGWGAGLVSPAILNWIREAQGVVRWLMMIEKQEFQHVIAAARKIHMKITIEGYEQKFRRAAHLPSNLAPDAVFYFILGPVDPETQFTLMANRGVVPAFDSFFYWGAGGRPCVEVEATSAMQAIALSVHIDRNFTVRRWTTCAVCHNGFESYHENDRFCSPKCKNAGTTATRRKDIALVRRADEAWHALPDKQRGNRGEWIIAWARRRSPEFNRTLNWVIKVSKAK